MFRSRCWIAAPFAALSLAISATAAVYEVTVTGETANTEVIGGDACGTGSTGTGACDGQTIVVVWQVLADDAPPDQSAEPGRGTYVADAPLFLSAGVTIHAQAFPLLSGPTLNRNQSIDLWDDLNASGITDRILFSLTGSDDGSESFVSSNVLLPQTFSGVGLDVLGTPFDGAPVLPGLSTFVLENELGIAIGQYGVTHVAMSAPEPLAAAQLAAAIAALVLTRRMRAFPP